MICTRRADCASSCNAGGGRARRRTVRSYPGPGDQDRGIDLRDLTSAGGLVRVADRFTIPATVAGIDEDLRIDFRALLLLASPSAPIAAAQAAVERAAAGEHITRAEADELIAQARAPMRRRRLWLKNASATAGPQPKNCPGNGELTKFPNGKSPAGEKDSADRRRAAGFVSNRRNYLLS